MYMATIIIVISIELVKSVELKKNSICKQHHGDIIENRNMRMYTKSIHMSTNIDMLI